MLDFQDMLNTCGLRDLGRTGNVYKWSNKWDHDFLVEERLDRFVVSLYWEHLFNDSEVVNFPTIGSDYTPIVLEIRNFNERQSQVR